MNGYNSLHFISKDNCCAHLRHAVALVALCELVRVPTDVGVRAVDPAQPSVIVCIRDISTGLGFTGEMSPSHLLRSRHFQIHDSFSLNGN